MGFTMFREEEPSCRERRPWRSAFARNRGTAQRPFPTGSGDTEAVPTEQTNSLESETPTRLQNCPGDHAPHGLTSPPVGIEEYIEDPQLVEQNNSKSERTIFFI